MSKHVIWFVVGALGTWLLTRKTERPGVSDEDSAWGFEIHTDGTSSPIYGTGLPGMGGTERWR